MRTMFLGRQLWNQQQIYECFLGETWWLFRFDILKNTFKDVFYFNSRFNPYYTLKLDNV